MKPLMILTCMLMTGNILAQEFKLLHYNIRELDSQKIKDQVDQINKVKSVIEKYDFDIMSLNEIQYDFPNVPDSSFTTEGKNLELLKPQLGIPAKWETSFYPANTGMNAVTAPDGTYYTNPNAPEARGAADQVNFGTLPGQYSTGAIYRFKKIKDSVFSNIKWKDFNPQIDLTQFASENGEPLPKDMSLFDKNFTDVAMKIGSKKVHLIIYHTVPSYHFGNPKSPNYARNRDQLRFLEWYLTGKTDIQVGLNSNLKLKPNEYFIAVGDWNSDVSDLKNEGSLVLKRLFSKSNLWMNQNDLSFSNEGGGFAPVPFRLMLDYMVTSKNIEVLEGKIIHPNFNRVELGCGDDVELSSKPGYLLKSYTENRKTCHVLITEEYDRFKKASDHYPIWGHFKLK